MTDFVNVRIHITMLVKIKYETGKLYEIARYCRVAPCTIILANDVKNETELTGEITVPVVSEMFCKIIKNDKQSHCGPKT